MPHEIKRVRHETKRRTLLVTQTERMSARMVRISFSSPELTGFVSAAPDDHIKLFFKSSTGDVAMRDFTPRRFDTSRGTLDIDFALHASGPATEWAAAAKIGDTLEIGGPRGSVVVPQDFDWWILIGDETALPAMGRWVEELGANRRVTTLGAVAGKEEEQTFSSAADLTSLWVHRPPEDADKPAPVLEACDKLRLPAGDGYVWIAAEASVARALRTHVVERLGHPLAWTKAAGYWKRGVADAHERISDEPR